MVKEFSLSKSERLSGRLTFSSLFETGKSVYYPPLRLLFKMDGVGPHPASMAVSVPKRLFKRAVDRNLLKRRIREAYRLNKKDLYTLLLKKDMKLNLVIQYRHQQIVDFHIIEEALKKGLIKLAETLDLPVEN